MKSEFIARVKKLGELSRKLQDDLENLGLSPMDGTVGMALNQLFNSNIKNIISSCQALARGAHGEGASLRLKNDLPSSLRNLEKISKTPQGLRLNELISQVKTILEYIQEVYSEI